MIYARENFQKKSSLVSWTGTALGAEIKAIIHEILLCIEEKLSPITIFTHSPLVMIVMNGEEIEIEVTLNDIQEARELAGQEFVGGVFHVYKSVNRAAYCLAQFSQITSQTVWKSCF